MSDDIMSRVHDLDYLARRQQQARAAARASTDPAARHAHETMAERYANELRAISAAPAR